MLLRRIFYFLVISLTREALIIEVNFASLPILLAAYKLKTKEKLQLNKPKTYKQVFQQPRSLPNKLFGHLEYFEE